LLRFFFNYGAESAGSRPPPFARDIAGHLEDRLTFPVKVELPVVRAISVCIKLVREARTMSRIAHCSCGSLRVETTGEPPMVMACHCTECQRRTGGPFGVGVYFDKAQVRAEGDNKVFIRDGQEGRKLRLHFCPACGTTVYWDLDLRPDVIGVALGAFADPSFPAPARSIWEEHRHSWVAFGHDLEHFPQSTTVARPIGRSDG
jgi:hypothetical protein